MVDMIDFIYPMRGRVVSSCFKRLLSVKNVVGRIDVLLEHIKTLIFAGDALEEMERAQVVVQMLL